MFGVPLDLKTVAPLATEQLNRRLIGRELMCGQQINGGHLFQRTLAVDVEQAQAVDFIIEEVEAVGLLATHREQVKQGAAGGVLPVFHYLIHMAIAGAVQLSAQGVTRQTLAFFHHQRVSVEEIMRTDALHECADRHDQHAALHGG